MEKKFKKVGVIGRQRTTEILDTLTNLLDYLVSNKLEVLLEEDTAALLTKPKFDILPRQEFAKNCDLVVVVGGDGSMLHAAHLVVEHNTPVVGINRGRLGFLTDIHPKEVNTYLGEILVGNYLEEKRFLLDAAIHNHNGIIYHGLALNDVVLLPGDYAHMIEFEIYINHQLVCSQRADGHIIATPTGSTAYALSGGGPILHPTLDAIVLVPMFSHTLSNRPIVVEGNSEIEIYIGPQNETSPRVSCDGQTRIPIAPGDTLQIRKKEQQLVLLHPLNYNYYETLRSKLHWQTKL